MHITVDPAKDRLNIAKHGMSQAWHVPSMACPKHGMSLALGSRLEWDQMVCREDRREDYAELRLQCFAPIADRIDCMICIEDDDEYRIISLREATPREVKGYVRHRQHR